MENICSECGAHLTLKQAIEILNGSGVERIAKVKRQDGKTDFIPANLVNPREVVVLEEPLS